MLEIKEIQNIMSHFGLCVQSTTAFYDTSHGDDDKRLNYILDEKYVLKVNSVAAMWEERLWEIHRLIYRYRSIGIYCPDLIPTLGGSLSYTLQRDGKEYTCFVEEYAVYPIFDSNTEQDRKEIVEHLGILAAKYTGIDLSPTRSMWSIIDLAPLDVDIDEKQENTNALTAALRKNGYGDLADKVDDFNIALREKIMTVFDRLPRCVYQGDLNDSNELHDNGYFVGLIDFNMAGTDVNINVFLNETNWFPTTEEFEKLSVAELIEKQDSKQAEVLSAIFKHYTLNDDEKYALPYYKRIVDMFQYPDVCLMIKWLGDDSHRYKCVEFINALIEKPL